MNGDIFGSAASRQPERGRAASGDAVRPLSVSALNAFARSVLESRVPPVWVSGEVSGWKIAPQGHCYFSLKDKKSVVRCVLWASDAERLPTHPNEGMQVRVYGQLTLYEQRGDFQLRVRTLEAEAAGGLWRVKFEKIRVKLEQEGLLAQERKRPLPRFPSAVGVVTSPVGAALHDILNVVRRRAPWTRVVLASARVQGEGAARDVARAIRALAETDVDVIIVGRGGGSAEDLWTFNEEIVARAIAASPMPVVSAVGHEVDVTIADLTADVRAPTPSAAAERVVPDRNVLQRDLATMQSRLAHGLRRRGTLMRTRLDRLQRDLHYEIRNLLRNRADQLGRLAAKLEALSPLSALRRGYAVALTPSGEVLRNTSQFQPGEDFHLRVVDGTINCSVQSVSQDNAP